MDIYIYPGTCYIDAYNLVSDLYFDVYIIYMYIYNLVSDLVN